MIKLPKYSFTFRLSFIKPFFKNFTIQRNKIFFGFHAANLKIAMFMLAVIHFLNFDLYAQNISGNPWQIDSLIIVKSENFKYHFPSRHIVQKQTLRIVKNGVPLNESSDFSFEQPKIIQFFPPPEPGDSLYFHYRRLPFNLKESYELFKRDTLKAASEDSAKSDSARIRLVPAKIENPFEDFGKGLQKSGSIMRGVNIGTNRDLTLNSGLNLELSGQLSENVEIIAALTDESTPIQPEGNTQTLDEVDRVFVQFKSPYVDGTVGDFNLNYEGTQFGNLSRKLQGLNLLGKYSEQYIGATVATTRGFFNRISFVGQEGNQGPYQLTGKNGEREIIVLAGTERVWINGTRLVRGEANDYVIEYANGQVVFTTNRLVTSESRIEIDFEYFPAIQKYNRDALSGLSGGSLFNNVLKYRVSFFQEQDNINQALEEEDELTKEEKEILKQAGDDFAKSSISGENFVGAGNGNYVKTDTVLTDTTVSIYRYVGATLGDYTVSFTFTGGGQGDYQRDRLGKYRWVGIDAGEYDPVKLIPLPQKQQLTDINVEWKPANNISISSEYALSNLDRNTYSSLQNEDNTGNAFMLKARASELKPVPLGIKLGLLDVDFNSRFIESDFQAVDRYNEPDFQRYWNVLQENTLSNEEKSIQFNSRLKPADELLIGLNLGNLEKDQQSSQRYSTLLQYDNPNWFKSDLNYEIVSSSLSSGNIKNDWHRFDGYIQKNIGNFQPQILYQYENRRNEAPAGLSGFSFDDYGFRLGLINWNYFAGMAQINKRLDKVYDVENNGRLVPQARTNTFQFRIQLQNLEETAASLEVVHRTKDYTSRFEKIKQDTLKLRFADATFQDTVWQDRSTNLAELKVSHSRWKKAVSANLQYRISTEQTALREKVYIKVQQGQGTLRFDDKLGEYVPDPDGDYILFILPSGKFEPVTKLQSALRLSYDPAQYWRNPKGAFQTLLSQVSGNSYIRIEEETKEEDLAAIYLLDLSKFQGDSTLRGSFIFDQDIYIMKRNRDLNFRILYRYRDDLFNQFLDENENENRLTIERGFRTDWKISAQVKSQSEISQKITKRNNAANITRNRNINGLFLNQRFFYRPLDHWEFRFNTEYGTEENNTQFYPMKLWFAVGKAEANYVLAGTGRITADFEYQTVNTTSNPLNLTVPYEMANGKKKGISKKWQFRAEYTVAKNILFTLLYTGRDEAGFDKVIHTGQAEVRAFF